MTLTTLPPIERHPLKPFLPIGAKILMLGSFPPKRDRWSMDFFYPNYQNDMWRIMGHIFFNDRHHFEVPNLRIFNQELIEDFCCNKGLALYDTACEVRRLKDNASDKFLDIVTPTDLNALIGQIPQCQAIVTTGEKASRIITETFACTMPNIGAYTDITHLNRTLRFWRMPSSSRAYPLSLNTKAEHYLRMLKVEHIIDM